MGWVRDTDKQCITFIGGVSNMLKKKILQNLSVQTENVTISLSICVIWMSISETIVSCEKNFTNVKFIKTYLVNNDRSTF